MRARSAIFCRGDRLPSWPVARTLIEALGADDRRLAEMFGLWKVAQAEARAGRTDWSMPPPGHVGPSGGGRDAP